jgi:proton-coupled amino acid transporter
MKKVCNSFIVVTQLGFCSVYVLFVGTTLNDVAREYGVDLDIHIWITLGLIPIWLTAMIRTLKFIGEFD